MVMDLLKKCASLKLTVVCLFVLFILVFWGTMYQVEHGLYAAQQRFYQSWYFLAAGVLPFPGTQLVLTVLFVNLLAAMVVHFQYGWKHLGIILIHVGLLLLLGGGFVIQQHAQESFLTLTEGEGSNVSTAYHDWELAVWQEDGRRRQVAAVDADEFQPGQTVDFRNPPVRFEVQNYYPSCRALVRRDGRSEMGAANPSGIHALEPVPRSTKPEENIPGGWFRVRTAQGEEQRWLFYGNDPRPHRLTIDGQEYRVALRRKRFPIPLVVRLVEFRKEMHPNSEIPKSFSSLVELNTPVGARQALIEMNKPLRYQGHTLYQASYAEFEGGQEASTFAVVKNYGRLLPYVASVVAFLGLLNHFFIEVYVRKRETAVPTAS